MKKFLVLTLVLGIASLASAALTTIDTWDNGNVVWTLDLVNLKLIGTGEVLGTYNGDYIDAGQIAPTPVDDLTGGIKDGIYAIAGDLSTITAAGTWYLPAAEVSPEPAVAQALGVWFEFDVTPDGQGDVVIDAYTGGETVTVLQGTVPEPATLALLGLGALVLRRRK